MHTTLDLLIKDDGEENNQQHQNIRKILAEPIYLSDDTEFI